MKDLGFGYILKGIFRDNTLREKTESFNFRAS